MRIKSILLLTTGTTHAIAALSQAKPSAVANTTAVRKHYNAFVLDRGEDPNDYEPKVSKEDKQRKVLQWQTLQLQQDIREARIGGIKQPYWAQNKRPPLPGPLGIVKTDYNELEKFVEKTTAEKYAKFRTYTQGEIWQIKQAIVIAGSKPPEGWVMTEEELERIRKAKREGDETYEPPFDPTTDLSPEYDGTLLGKSAHDCRIRCEDNCKLAFTRYTLSFSNCGTRGDLIQVMAKAATDVCLAPAHFDFEESDNPGHYRATFACEIGISDTVGKALSDLFHYPIIGCGQTGKSRPANYKPSNANKQQDLPSWFNE